MKTYKYIALAALALGFTACSQDDDFTPQQEDAVQIASAHIATEVQTRVNTLDDGTEWSNKDQILLVNNSRTNGKNSGTYTATVDEDAQTTTWELTSGIVLYASSGTNDFTAYYPASETFTLPTDQSTEAGIMSADRMVATTNGVAKNAAVALTFERQNAMVTITPSFNTEFGSDATISGLQIAGITSYHPASATDYKAIIAPCTGFEVTVNVKVGETEQTLTAASTTEIEAGKHYTFSLTVGKEAVKIADVKVTPWTEQPINGVDTDETLEVSTLEEMEAAVAKGGYIMLMADITQSESYYTVAKNTVINLNGHSITGGELFHINKGGTLTISGNGVVKNTDIYTTVIINQGILNLQGGTFEGYIYTYGQFTVSGGALRELVVEGGTCTITGGYIRDLYNRTADSPVTISGGHVDAFSAYYAGATYNITGGTFGFNPTNYLAEGYTATEADGIWTVAPSNN